MPDASLPTTARGWAVALASSLVGFFAGFYSLHLFARWFA